MLHVYNTLSREIEPFKPLSQTEVKVYCCGPTVYNFAHIGNLRTYLFEDFFVRTLRFLGYKARVTMNLTDIDDKTIRDSQKNDEPLLSFTERYTEKFLEDMDALHIVRPDNIVPISSLVDEMVLLIQGLLDKGYAYLAEDGSVYYRISKFKQYGNLAHLDFAGMKTSVRVNNDEYAKDAAADFALWKAYDAAADGPNQWEAKFIIDGQEHVLVGRPGWHIECSACNMKYFGPQIDVHMGGVDNIFPHHQNEIAQSEAFTGKTFAKYWIHGEHLMVEGKKMAKSANNFYTLRQIFEKYPNIPASRVAAAFRLLTFSTKYRESFNFTFASLEAAMKTLDGFDSFLDRLASLPRTEGRVRKEMREFVQVAMMDFVDLLEDDLNTPSALARIHGFIGDANRVIDAGVLYAGEIQAIIELLKSFDSVLGLFDFTRLDQESIPEDIAALVSERDLAKQNKDYARADTIREQVESLGYDIVDTKNGAVARKRR